MYIKAGIKMGAISVFYNSIFFLQLITFNIVDMIGKKTCRVKN